MRLTDCLAARISGLLAIVVWLIPTDAAAQAPTFADTPATHWAFDFVEAFAYSGITSGCGGDNYCPDAPVTRAQMAVFLERSMRGAAFTPPPASGTLFGDVAATDFAASFIEQLLLDGITSGCGGGNYCSNDAVTRAQMAVFLERALRGAGYQPPPAVGLFGDVAPSDFAAGFIEQLAADGITSGCGNGNYCPLAPVTRAQMAVFIVRAFELPARPRVFAKAQSSIQDMRAADVIQTSDGGYAHVGYVDMDASNAVNTHLLVVKLDEYGAVEWTRGFDASGLSDDWGFAIKTTEDGGYVVTGITDTFSDVWVLKLDPSGNLDWEFAYGSGSHRFGYDITPVDGDDDGAADDGYLIVGVARVPRDSALVIRLDALGNVLWQRLYPTAYSSAAYSAIQTADGGFVVAGELYPESLHGTYWVMKLDAAGGTVWQRSYSLLSTGGQGLARIHAVRQTDDDGDGDTDDGYFVAGYADILDSSSIAWDVWVLKLDESGDITWQKRYGDAALSEVVADAELAPSGNLVITGTAENDLMLLEIDPSGTIVDQKTYGGISGDSGQAIDVTNDGGVVLFGDVQFEVGRRDTWIVKLDATAEIEFAPGNNISSDDLALDVVDTTATATATSIGADTTIVTGEAAIPAVSAPSITVTTQSL